MVKKFQILLFSKDSDLQNILFLILKRKGFCVFLSKDSLLFWKLFYKFTFDLIIIDIDDKIIKETFGIIKKIQFITPKIKIILISKHDLPIPLNYIKNFEYMVKPFLLEDLDVKISNAFKAKPNFFSFYSLKSKFIIYIYENFYKIQVSSVFINLTRVEFNLFEFLLSSTNNICDKSTLLKYVLGYDDKWSFESNIIEMHFSKLKKKISNCIGYDILYKKGECFYLFNKKIK